MRSATKANASAWSLTAELSQRRTLIRQVQVCRAIILAASRGFAAARLNVILPSEVSKVAEKRET